MMAAYHSTTHQRLRRRLCAAACALLFLLVGCAKDEPVLLENIRYFEGPMPADFSGSWARDYARGDDIDQVVRDAWYELSRRVRTDLRSGSGLALADRDMAYLMPLARLAELITRQDELTISQTDNEILIERKDDFALFCAFYDGVGQTTDNLFGKESCGWDENRLINFLQLPDGLRVLHRFTISDDRKQLRVVTTVSSDTSKVPITLERYFWRFEKITPKYKCIETLSMKRVCSTGEVSP